VAGRFGSAVPPAADTGPEESGQIRSRRTGEGGSGSRSREEEIHAEEVGRPHTSMRVTIYHNPRCGTSRKTLDLIRAKGLEPEIIDYLRTPPSAAELDRILSLLKMDPRDLMRKKEDEYKTLKLERTDLTRKELIKAMIDHPILIERPIVLSKGKAALGRPPENVTAIL
jgi:arsenate reductase